MAPFDSYTFIKAREQISSVADDRYEQQATEVARATGYVVNRRLYAGDHWLDGGGWTGPRPSLGDTEAQQVLVEIRRAFVSKNAVREVVQRHVGAVIGREPVWRFALRRPLGIVEEIQADGTTKKVDEIPTNEERALIDEAEAVLTQWWDARGAHSLVQNVTATLLLAKRGVLRLFVPPGLLNDGRVPLGTLSESMERIFLHTPDPTQAAVVTDADTQQQAGVYIYATDDQEEYAELVALDESGRTRIRILASDGDAVEAEPLVLGGRLTMYELARNALITPQVCQQQYLLNMACTMMGRNVVLAGFLERILLNVQLPGTYEGEGTAKRFVPDPFRVGAGTTNVLMGATYTDEQGVTRMATPSVVYRDPISVQTFVETKQDAYTAILEETNQLHALISGDAAASGESRKQARADFETSLLDTQAQLNRAGRWLLETLLAMASAFAGTPGRFDSLRAVFECRIDTGPMSSDEQREVRENVMAGLLSEETGMARIGVDDVDAERERITAEREARQPTAQASPASTAAPVVDNVLSAALQSAQQAGV